MPKTVSETTGHGTARKTGATAAAGMPLNVDMDRVADASQKSMLAFAHLHSRLIRNALEVNAELLDFARQRVTEDIQANDKLCRCNNVTDAMEVMSGFYQKAFEAYAEEANKIVRIGTDAARRSIEETQAEADDIGRD